MALPAGTRIGPYEVVAPLGAGGMGEVYRACDTQLKRDVALKVLPEAFANDPERLARFRREAELLATLNHPHIAAIYGLDQSGAATAIILELVEGDTLADVIARGPIAVDDALPVARQIAEALEAAHERGVIHRDLKPANVKITSAGTVKVLDFGLAKLVGPSEETASGAQGMTLSPTLSLHATYAGVILGTAAYMSPEQARARPVDRRTDVWSFGCVLFEMLTGRRTFDAGDTISDAVAAVLKNEPEWTLLPANTPDGLRDLVRRCLRKDPGNRLRDIGDARIALEELIAHPGVAAAPPTPGARRSVWPIALASGVAVVAIAMAAALWLTRQPAPALPVMRLIAETGVKAPLALGAGPAAVLSPDGRLLVLVATPLGQRAQLFVRRIDQVQATALPGTDGARNAFFSPDGQWIAFFADGKLKKTSAAGGIPITLCDAEDDRGGTWSDDGSIVFAPNTRSGLLRVAAAGGMPSPLTTLDATKKEITHRWPHALPGGRGVVFIASATSNNYEDAEIVVQNVATGRRDTVQHGYAPRYAPSGHLLFLRQGRLFATPFDVERLAATGDAVPVLEDVMTTSNNGGSQLAVSASGALTYVTGSVAGGMSISMATEGKTTTLRQVPDNYLNIRFSPDGRRLAMEIGTGQYDIHTYEWERDALSRLTFEATQDADPVWSPAGRHIAFASQRGDKSVFNLYWQDANGTSDARRLTESPNAQFPESWHPGGRFLAFSENTPQTAADVMILPLEGDEATGWKAGTATAFANTRFSEDSGAFSPDGRWLAYKSDESRRNEVYVRPFPGPGGKWQVSTAGGVMPIWSRQTNDLLFAEPTGRIMAVRYSADGDVFKVEAPRPWFDLRLVLLGGRTFDLHPDGRRMVTLTAQDQVDDTPNTLTFLFNAGEELRRMAPATR